MVTAIWTLWVKVPLLPVTVTVPLSGVGGRGGVALDEPPHDAVVNIMVMTSTASRPLEGRRFFLRAVRDRSRRGTNSTTANKKLLSIPSLRGQGAGGLSSWEVSTAALMVSVEVPLPVTLTGLGEQVVVPSPATVQERLTVPENPASAVTVIVSVPTPPLLITSDELPADKAKSGFEGPFHAEANAETSTEPQPLATS